MISQFKFLVIMYSIITIYEMKDVYQEYTNLSHLINVHLDFINCKYHVIDNTNNMLHFGDNWHQKYYIIGLTQIEIEYIKNSFLI
jgi:hypothetical protein